jgi:DNA mismatch endonuclease Vsr
MADNLSSEQRSMNMRAVKGKNTKPELFVRRALYRSGYRYRLHNTKLPGKPDVVLANSILLSSSMGVSGTVISAKGALFLKAD